MCGNIRLKSETNSCRANNTRRCDGLPEKTQTPSSSGASTGMQRIVAFVGILDRHLGLDRAVPMGQDKAALLVEHPFELLPRIDLRNHTTSRNASAFS